MISAPALAVDGLSVYKGRVLATKKIPMMTYPRSASSVEEITFLSRNGQNLRVHFSGSPAVGGHKYVLSAAKCGSTLLYKMLGEYFNVVNMPYTDLPRQFFAQGVLQKDIPDEVYNVIDRIPGIYIGFRTLFGLPKAQSFATAPKFVLVRDPRDALVSHYFSVRQSHSLPALGGVRENLLRARAEAGDLDIDDFITRGRRGKFIPETLRALAHLDPKTTRLFRYEDVIFDKERWLAALLEAMGAVSIDRRIVASIAAENDVRPSTEDASRHIRRVTPGDFRSKLRPSTIGWIESQYGDVLDLLGYERCGATDAQPQLRP